MFAVPKKKKVFLNHDQVIKLNEWVKKLEPGKRYLLAEVCYKAAKELDFPVGKGPLKRLMAKQGLEFKWSHTRGSHSGTFKCSCGKRYRIVEIE